MKRNKPKLTDKEVIGRAKRFADSYKTSDYSGSAFSEHLFYEKHYLIMAGATKKQLQLFDSELSKIPIRGGRFKSYCGD